MGQKLFVIGLDGATFDLLGPWLDQGHLPTLQRLIQNGIAGPLWSTFPPLTGPAWSSFMTGKSPGAHGVFEFFRHQPASYSQKLNTRLDIDGRSLWRLLSDGGLQVGVIGVPLTYPPETLDGFIITGLLTPPRAIDFTYPPGLREELERRFGGYRVRHDDQYRPGDPAQFLTTELEILENNTQAALYLMAEKPWDFFMVHFLGTDRIQHDFWHTLDPRHPRHDPAEAARLGNAVLHFFQAVDATVARLLAALDEATAVIIMSDHGFGPVYKFINFNTWLLQEGFLHLKKSARTRLRYLLFRLGFNYSVLGNWILKLGVTRRAKQMGRARREAWQRRLFLSLDDVDWRRSRVYSMGNFGQLYVNLIGREGHGIVAPGAEYEALLEEVSGRLRAMEDPETGAPVIESILRGADMYVGPHAEHAPDLLFFTRNMEYKAMGLSDFSSYQVFEPVFGTTGHHRMNGMLICHGPGTFRAGAAVQGARIHDLAPTILYLMDQPIPRDMDGQVLLNLFTESFGERHTLTSEEGEVSGRRYRDSGLSADEEAALTEHLRALGYVT